MPIHPKSRGGNMPRVAMAVASFASLTLAPYIHIKEKPEVSAINQSNNQLASFIMRRSFEPKDSRYDLSDLSNFLKLYSKILEREPGSKEQLLPSTSSPALKNWLHTLGMCESGDNFRENTGNGYYGAYQFSQLTWNSLKTGYANPIDAPPSVQDQAIIDNTNKSIGGLFTQNHDCFEKEKGSLSEFPPN